MSAAKVSKEPYQQSVDEILAVLDTDGRRGLSEKEAQARLARHGKNESDTTSMLVA